MVQTRNHTSTSKLDARDGKIVLTQEFREQTYYNASPLVIGIAWRQANTKFPNDATVRLSAALGRGQ
jgi:hypothetical protein